MTFVKAFMQKWNRIPEEIFNAADTIHSLAELKAFWIGVFANTPLDDEKKLFEFARDVYDMFLQRFCYDIPSTAQQEQEQEQEQQQQPRPPRMRGKKRLQVPDDDEDDAEDNAPLVGTQTQEQTRRYPLRKRRATQKQTTPLTTSPPKPAHNDDNGSNDSDSDSSDGNYSSSDDDDNDNDNDNGVQLTETQDPEVIDADANSNPDSDPQALIGKYFAIWRYEKPGDKKRTRMIIKITAVPKTSNGNANGADDQKYIFVYCYSYADMHKVDDLSAKELAFFDKEIVGDKSVHKVCIVTNHYDETTAQELEEATEIKDLSNIIKEFTFDRNEARILKKDESYAVPTKAEIAQAKKVRAAQKEAAKPVSETQYRDIIRSLVTGGDGQITPGLMETVLNSPIADQFQVEPDLVRTGRCKMCMLQRPLTFRITFANDHMYMLGRNCTDRILQAGYIRELWEASSRDYKTLRKAMDDAIEKMGTRESPTSVSV